ncbi:type III-A CRISPR-associated protein Csm2 [Sphaerochaeta sp. S2]|uniref:type III-A CRISPR-associated protein Csm2 n=1 Tax=Sphaerochaeta sp. S2 TaxID=2798868 RepID=UPI0018E9F7A7|nr:type III-A CRISPR-associated protein Csm2 [Sphaerochaeta sp. S2]MBJ2356728.1 type III-A CRISPR-associated protein Csm2 [Sphaerochaeta sp. S2]
MLQPRQGSGPSIIGGFYEDGESRVKPDLFDTKAQEIAKKLYKVSQYRGRDVTNGVSGTQLRRIFDEVKRFDYLLQLDAAMWESQLPYIKMIKSKVCYTIARSTRNLHNSDEIRCYDVLSAFLIEGIDSIHKQKDYEVFLALFEAVYGFYYEHAPNRS